MSETTDEEDGPKGGWTRFLPLIVFCAMAALFAGYLMATQFLGYERDTLPSALLGAPAPETDLAPLFEGRPGLDPAALRGEGVKVVNVWASWCGPCRVEHPFLMELAAEGVEIHGLNYKDEPAAAKRFLSELGDPYAAIGVDPKGRAGIEWGVYGVPETFVIDGAGRIVLKHVGPIQNDDLDEIIRPALREAAES